jgi:hypothetical protein
VKCRCGALGATLLALVIAPPPAPALELKPVVRWWVDHQLPSGAFPNVPANGPSPHYGQTMMALALALNGHRSAAARAVEHWIRHPPRIAPHPPFNLFAAAATYRLMPTATRARWRPTIRRLLDAEIGHWLTDRYISNWAVVMAAAGYEADRAGIGSYRRRVVDWLQRVYLPATENGYGGDRRTWPLAYHTFATAFLARIAAGTREPSLRAATVAGCRWIADLTSPRGRIAWAGRSHQQSFVQASGIYALRRCERFDPVQGARYEGAVARIERVLASDHRPVHGPLAIVPRQRIPGAYDRLGLDTYAFPEVYNALTLAFLSMAPRAAAAPSTGSPGFAMLALGKESPSLVVARSRAGWIGLSARLGDTGPIGAIDARYLFGVQSAEVGGRPIVPAQPIGGVADLGLPTATDARPDGSGGILLDGPGYRARVAIVGCRVRETVVLEHGASLRVGGRLALGAGERVTRTRDGWRSHRHVLIVRAPLQRPFKRMAVGADAYRTAVVGGRVQLVAGQPLIVDRGLTRC